MVTSDGNQILNNNLILKSLTFHFLSKNQESNKYSKGPAR